MIELPETIYVDRFGVMFGESNDEDDTKYIREDIVDQMIEDLREYTLLT